MTRRTRRWMLPALVGLALAGAMTVHLLRPTPDAERQVLTPPGPARLYQCSMHPQIVSHEPGVCPICNMKLEPVEPHAAETPPPPAPGERPIVGYRHPMRPDVTSPTPAKDEMGMDYTPIYADELTAGESDVPERATFTLSTERQQLIGVTRGLVERRPLTVEIRTAARVAYDPALYQTLIEYREALRVRTEIAGSHLAEAHRSADALIAAARLKLRQKGVSETELAAMRAHGKDPVDLLLPERTAWIYAQVYEYELDLVRPGQRLELAIPSIPGAHYTAEVAAIDPILDPTTRSVRVRARLVNADSRLKPESFVVARLGVPLGERLAVPRDAVVDTGERKLVFVVRGEGQFTPRAVALGRQAGDWFEVLDGLAAGEEVVTSANFLIDSESRFRAAARAFAPSGGTP